MNTASVLLLSFQTERSWRFSKSGGSFNTSRDIVSKSLRRMTFTGSLSNCCLVLSHCPRRLRPHSLRCARLPLSSTTSWVAPIHVHCTESLRSHSYQALHLAKSWDYRRDGKGKEWESHVIRGVMLLEVILGYSLGEQPAQLRLKYSMY